MSRLQRSFWGGSRRGTSSEKPFPCGPRQQGHEDRASAAGWDAGATADNARAAARDPTTIAYLGDADFGATAISLPILNEAGVAQVSPASTYPGFTSAADGTEKGEPDKYQPSGVPTFARVIPTTVIEGQAQATYQRAEGCRRTFIVAGKDVPGRAAATGVRDALPQAGIAIANARLQAPRVAEVRRMALGDVLDLVEANTQDRPLGILGDPGVNVLELNLALDRAG